MKLNFKIEGLNLALNKFGKLENAVGGKATEGDSLKEAKVIAEDARSRAPLGPTGNLKRSLRAVLLDKRGDNPRPAMAGVDRKIAPHGWIVEFGTSRMSARPYFRPAVNAHKEGIVDSIKKRIARC